MGPAAPRRALPDFVPPELATLESAPPPGERWLHEVKFDGYRILARLEKKRARLLSRNNLDWTARFAGVAREVERLPASTALLDGEVVAIDAKGRSSFQRLQGALKQGTSAALVYYVFDLLHLDGRDLTGLPLEERKEALARLVSALGPDASLRYSDHTVGQGDDFFREACRHGLEGILCKRLGSAYRPGRGRDWIKVKCINRQEFVIGGYTEPRGSRADLGALIVGVAADRPDRLVYAGKVGTGFDVATLRALKRRLGPLETPASPFDPSPRGLRGVHWVRPEVVAEISFTEWTDDGLLRHPSFQGLREDKDPSEVRREDPKSGSAGEEADPPPKESRARKAGSPAPARSREPGGEIEVAGVRLTHPERVLFPEQGLTKLDLARYYERIAGRMLPHVAGRPLVLVRCPAGRQRHCFFQKHFEEGAPPEASVVRLPEEDNPAAPYLVIRNAPGLISLVQMGVLEVHVWGARADDVEKPDRLLFDLDPDPGLPWARVTAAARSLRERLERLGLPSFVKTTGGKGLHLVTPLARRSGWEEVKGFARAVVTAMARDDPGSYTVSASKKTRGGKIYLDYLRNGRGSTAVAAFSTRARPGAPVSCPVRWEEIDAMRPDGFTAADVPEILRRQRRDPWEGFQSVRAVLGKKALAAVRDGG